MDISVQTLTYQVEKRDWLLSIHGTEPGENPTVVLDVSKFTQATHFPNGYIPSGTALGKITATGLYGPYDPAAGDGRQTAAELLFSSLRVVNPWNASTAAKVGGAGLHRGEVDPAKLPFQTGAGSLDAAGKTALRLINFRAGA